MSDILVNYRIPKEYQKYFFTETEYAAILLMIKNYEVNGYLCYHFSSASTLITNPSYVIKEYVRFHGHENYKLLIYQNYICYLAIEALA